MIIPRGIGFPHSDISGSLLTYCSPKPFVVRHVLHRLLVPRHSPCALFYLTYFKLSFSLFSVALQSVFSIVSVFCFWLYSVFNVLALEVLPSKLNKVSQCASAWLSRWLLLVLSHSPSSFAFLRKEVIQPQVLLRLPCYDFTLIICPTLDGWLL